MFNFMKKAGAVVGAVGASGGEESTDREEKERRKKEKKERKEKQKRDRGNMSTDELLRIDEVRRSLKLRGRRKEKEKLPSGITADYSDFFAELNRDSNYSNYPLVSEATGEDGTRNQIPGGIGTSGLWREGLLQSDSSEASLNSLNNPNGVPRQAPNLPPLPPRPPKRGILKGPRLSNSNLLAMVEGQNSSAPDAQINGQDSNVLMQNTLLNEVIAYQNLSGPLNGTATSNDDLQNLTPNFTKKVIHSPVDGARNNYYNSYGSPPPITVTNYADHDNGNRENGNSIPCITSASPSADSLTDTTTNSSFATPPFSMSPTGDSEGFHRWSSNLEGTHLPLPEISPADLPPPRVLTICRQKAPRNDFGFSLRRAMIVERSFSDNGAAASSDEERDGVKMKAVIFAEPGALSQGHETGLLPGDRLLEVNGICVDDKSREEIIEMIKGSQDFVTVKVQPVAELSEVWRRWAALGRGGSSENVHQNGDDKDAQADTNSNKAIAQQDSNRQSLDNGTEAEESQEDGERVWVCHRGGFAAGTRRKHDPQNDVSPRSVVQLLHSGEEIEVDDDDLEKANPSQFDRVEDLASLRYLNESSALHALRQRYATNLVHTAAGSSLMLINPVAPLTIYSDKVAAMFKGCKWEDMPPHLYAAAQGAHRAMLASRRDQSIVFLGRRSSGKSSALRRAALYLCGNTNWCDKFRASLLTLAATTTCSGGPGGGNGGGSKCAQVMSLHYDQTGALASAELRGHLLDVSKLCAAVSRQRAEDTFDVINWVIHGCEGQLRRSLLLDGRGHRDQEAAALARLKGALKDLGVTEKEQLALWKVIAAIWHLAAAGATKVGGGGGRYHFSEPAAGAKAAQMLGCCSEELARALFTSATTGLSTPTQPRAAFRTPSPTDRIADREVSGQEAVEGLILGLYMEFFNCMVALINRSLATGARTVSSLLLVDPPGLSGGSLGASGGAGLYQLAANYLHERLQLLAHERAVLAPRAACRQEGVADDDGDDWIAEVMNPGPMVELLDRAPQNTLVRTSQADLRDADRKGLLWLLDEESMHPGASDGSFVERAVTQWSHFGGVGATAQHQLLRRAAHPHQFVLHHMQGTYPVLYNATGWLKASRENPVSRNSIGLLQESTDEDMSRLFVWSRGLCGAGPDAQASLRRASSIRRTLTTGTVVVNRRSLVAQVQSGAEGVLGALRRTRPRFVFCALARRPNPGATSNHPHDAPLDVPLLRSQFRGFQLLEAARMHKQGYPDSLPFAEFARRFRLLAASQQASEGTSLQPLPTSMTPDEQRRHVEEMLLAIDLDRSLYRIGLSQVLLRAGALVSLESRRDALLCARVVSLQALCRGTLARKRFARLRVQHVAARCVQRNVRAFLAVRDWPWWRLLVRVAPLLAVHRTEDQLRAKTEELETLRIKAEKLENERSSLKHENDKLENKLSEMTAELAVEQSAGSLASERLGAETSERLRLERDLLALKNVNTTLQQTSERLETELMYSRADTNGGSGTGVGGADGGDCLSDSEESGGSGGGSRYKRRLQAALRELDSARRQLRQQHEDDLEQLVTLKKQLEKKVADAYEEAEEQRQVAAQWKRKAQKAASDANDLRLLADEQGARGALLEKRQRRFDADHHQLQEEVRREKQARERVSREHDLLLAEKYAIEQSLSDTKMELEMKEEKLAAAQRELDDLTFGGKTEEEVGALKRIKHEMEKKCHDQEEELDEMAGQVQLLESHKVRLEMSLEQQRKAARLEAAQRDEELEEVRAQSAKKLKGLESQLETEHSERTLLLRERHELERRLTSLEESARAEAAERDAKEQRAKRDLRRARALARDAREVLETREKDSGAKAQLRQLRDKLDDAETTMRAAVKGRQVAMSECAEAVAAAEEAGRARREAEARAANAQREGTAAKAQLEEAEEEAAEVMKKYRACVQSLADEQRASREASARASAAEDEARQARERAAELASRLAAADLTLNAGQAAQHDKLELKSKELEARLELEQTARTRLEAQAARAREAATTGAAAAQAAHARELQAAEELRKAMRTVRELREELAMLTAKTEEGNRARSEAEARAETERAEAVTARQELRDARTRIALLQQAIADELSPDNESDSDNESYSSDESIETFLANHKVGPATNNIAGSNTPKSGEGRQSRSSVSSSKHLSPTKEPLT